MREQHDRNGQSLDPWSEELEPLEVRCHDGAPMLMGQIVVTPVNRTELHGALSLRGELCAASAPALTRSVDRLLHLGVVDLSFDLHDLRLCTSAGIELWLDVASRLEPVGGDLLLRNARDGVRRVLDVVGLSDSGVV